MSRRGSSEEPKRGPAATLALPPNRPQNSVYHPSMYSPSGSAAEQQDSSATRGGAESRESRGGGSVPARKRALPQRLGLPGRTKPRRRSSPVPATAMDAPPPLSLEGQLILEMLGGGGMAGVR